jgi:hypothetical protein
LRDYATDGRRRHFVPDVAEYPDTGKIDFSVDGEEWKLFRPADSVEYYD